MHCLTHSLNLCLQDATSSCQIIKESLLLVTELSTLVHASSKCLALYKNIQHQSASQASNKKTVVSYQVGYSYWSHKFSFTNYGTLCETLDEVGADTHGEPAAKALELQALITKFRVFSD